MVGPVEGKTQDNSRTLICQKVRQNLNKDYINKDKKK
jgi:hypothetical protein